MGQWGMTFAKWCSAVAVVFVVAPGIAAAADLSPEAPPPPPAAPATYAPPAPDWIITVGAEVRAIPAWPGAPTTKYGLTGFPLFALQKPGDPPFFFGARDGFGVPILDFGQLQLGPVGKLVLVPLGQWRLSGGPRLSLQSTAAVSPYFSITAAQSAASGLPVYNATGGFYSYGAGGQIEYFFNRQWQVHALVEYERITDSAANSPLVTMRGSPNQFTFGLGATYTFSMHPLW
jgi:hypothetical protein